MKTKLSYLFVFFLALLIISCSIKKDKWSKTALLFEDSGKNNWKEKWMLDGKKSEVLNTNEGMTVIAGTEYGNDASHTVLWTKKQFQGNIGIEYKYTRKDTTTRCVTILYFHASGKGDKDYPTDISLWNAQRDIPSMRIYFNNMFAYHISYAAFDAKEFSGENDYIRLRKYNPNGKGLKETNIPDDYFNTGLFKPNITYHITIYKYSEHIEMQIQNTQNKSEKLICTWNIPTGTGHEFGRIGLRHMYTRNATYADFKVWKLE